MTVCTAKHTKHQPDDNDWRCPNCGADRDYFYVYEGQNLDCELLHEDDHIICDYCDSEYLGKKLAQKLGGSEKKCPHCDGTGWIGK